MRGAIPPLPQYASIALCSVKKYRDIFTFTFYPIVLRFILILSYLSLDLPSGFFSPRSQNIFLYEFYIVHTRATWFANLTLPDVITLTIFEKVYK